MKLYYRVSTDAFVEALVVCSSKRTYGPQGAAAQQCAAATRPGPSGHQTNHPTDARRKCPWGMLGFKDFRCARIILSGIEVMHIIRKGQMQVKKDTHPSAAGQFYSLVM